MKLINKMFLINLVLMAFSYPLSSMDLKDGTGSNKRPPGSQNASSDEEPFAKRQKISTDSAAAAQVELGDRLLNNEEFEEAAEHYEKAVRLFKKQGMPSRELLFKKALEGLIACHNELENYWEAALYSVENNNEEKAQEMWEKIGKDSELASIIASSFFERGEIAKAILFYRTKSQRNIFDLHLQNNKQQDCINVAKKLEAEGLREEAIYCYNSLEMHEDAMRCIKHLEGLVAVKEYFLKFVKKELITERILDCVLFWTGDKKLIAGYYSEHQYYKKAADCYNEIYDYSNAIKYYILAGMNDRAMECADSISAQSPREALEVYKKCERYQKALKLIQKLEGNDAVKAYALDLIKKKLNPADIAEIAFDLTSDPIFLFEFPHNRFSRGRLAAGILGAAGSSWIEKQILIYMNYGLLTEQILDNVASYNVLDDQLVKYYDALKCHEKALNSIRLSSQEHCSLALDYCDKYKLTHLADKLMLDIEKSISALPAFYLFIKHNKWQHVVRLYLKYKRELEAPFKTALNQIEQDKYYPLLIEIYVALGDHLKAAECFKNLCDWEPACRHFVEAREYDKAVECLKEMLDYDDNSASLKELAASLLFNKFTIDAEDFNAAVCHQLLGNFQDAAHLFWKAKKYCYAFSCFKIPGIEPDWVQILSHIDPSIASDEIFSQLGEIFYSLDQFREAGLCFFYAKKYSKAMDSFSKYDFDDDGVVYLAWALSLLQSAPFHIREREEMLKKDAEACIVEARRIFTSASPEQINKTKDDFTKFFPNFTQFAKDHKIFSDLGRF